MGYPKNHVKCILVKIQKNFHVIHINNATSVEDL